MNFLAALAKMGLEVDDLKKVLEFVAGSSTDLGPVATRLLEKLGSAPTPEKLAELASVIPHELLNASRGDFDGRFHPGSAG